MLSSRSSSRNERCIRFASACADAGGRSGRIYALPCNRWINRNRFLRNGADALFTLPLKKGSDYLDVSDRALADDFDPAALLNPLAAAYRKASFFAEAFPVIEAVIAETGDPLPRVRQWLASQNMLDAAAESALRAEVDAEVGAALAPAR